MSYTKNNILIHNLLSSLNYYTQFIPLKYSEPTTKKAVSVSSWSLMITVFFFLKEYENNCTYQIVL